MPELDTTKLCKDCKNAIVYGLPRGCYCQLTKKADGINPVTGEPQTHTHTIMWIYPIRTQLLRPRG